MKRFRVVGTLLGIVLMVVAASVPATAKEPREWRIVYLDTEDEVRITDPALTSAFFSEVHYSITGGTPVEPDLTRAPTAEVFGNPCNPPYSCEGLWYRYYAGTPAKPAFMNYYLSDGTLYETWTHADLQDRMDSHRRVSAPIGADAPGSTGIPTYAAGVLIVFATAASVSAWGWRRRRKQTPEAPSGRARD